mmetsp:Transcript_49889/g.97617  ORF Transcript_49889/g.97617 Transcript_49889/m.97617 type:complete len:543 (-) Transcript_49889:185-1813(-)|eukprot:CAMPEP_0194316748 /NCGR_PEP_ID=MMETSP0171-20130528/13520_1 /TAXON_ID=218684 /ORGANISM="Corethron pennatum, Strain L29A3" /LENGTH=542 /DNA_ID=CAMNT_0039073103 /DNA_START=61 /DNA_END=1689 /DNA_ORIENTATION=+
MAGNSWNEQELAFFGTSISPTQPTPSFPLPRQTPLPRHKPIQIPTTFPPAPYSQNPPPEYSPPYTPPTQFGGGRGSGRGRGRGRGTVHTSKKNDGDPSRLFSSGASSIRKLARDMKYGADNVSKRIAQTAGSYSTYPAQARRPLPSQPTNSPHTPIPAHYGPPPVRRGSGRLDSNRKHATAPTPTPTPAPASAPTPAPAPAPGRRKNPSFPSLASVKRWVTDAVPSCRVCGALAPNPYSFHPFFPSEKICCHHNDVPKCSGCNRFETPSHQLLDPSKEFVDLEDNGRKLCPACTRSIIVDSADLKVAWDSVLIYFDHVLGMYRNAPQSKERMQRIPILAVGHDGLNDPSVRGSGHGQGNTRGLCMYEYRSHPLGGSLRHMFDQSPRGSKSFASAAISSVLDFAADTLSGGSVTAILCLRGLPRDLAASILAHEATHAWFKLHPRFEPKRPMPLQVEEGCCQLMAYQYLVRLEESDLTGDRRDYGDDGEPTDRKMRQYFRNSIETDTSEVYGDGFRLAAAAFAKLGCVASLLEYVAENNSFPS